MSATENCKVVQTAARPTTGADVLVESLARHGVDIVFAYPGGASMPLHQALTRFRDKIRTILPRHEQGGIFAAQGYARTTGKAGRLHGHQGPGRQNLVTALADAKLDRIPLVAITGQVAPPVIGTDAFQETPIVEVCRSDHQAPLPGHRRPRPRPGRQGGVPPGHHRPAGPGADRPAQGRPEHDRRRPRLRRADGPAGLQPTRRPNRRARSPRCWPRSSESSAAGHLRRRRRDLPRTPPRSFASSPPRRASP